MDKARRKELTAQYREMKTYMGVVKITNTENGRMYIAGYPNLKNKWASIQSQLENGLHVSSALQRDWNRLGPGAFTYEVLEQASTEDVSDVPWTVKRMELAWLLKLEPFGEGGYNKPPK